MNNTVMNISLNSQFMINLKKKVIEATEKGKRFKSRQRCARVEVDINFP